MAAIMEGTRYGNYRKFRNADGVITASGLGLEENWLSQNKAPLYLFGSKADNSIFKSGDIIIYENQGSKIKATISDIGDDPTGWGMSNSYMTALILSNPDVPFNSLTNTSGGIVYLAPVTSTQVAVSKTTTFLRKYGIIILVAAIAGVVYFKYVRKKK
jgi:hypothetical protein